MQDFPPFPVDSLDEPDEYVGKLLLGWFIGAQAVKLGIQPDEISELFAERVRKYVLTLEANDADDAAIEIALHKAANGDFAYAGAFCKKYFQTGARHLATSARLFKELNEKHARPSAGGRKTAEIKKSENKNRNDKIRQQFAELISTRTSARDAPAILAKRFSLSTKQIKRIISEK